MLRKINLVPVLLAVSAVFLFAGNSMAACLFRLEKGGPILSCSTCKCDVMKDAGVDWAQCIDVKVVPNSPKDRFEKIIRYSEKDVRIRTGDGEESPLASDESQRQFDELLRARDARERMGRLKPTVGAISNERLDALAKLLGVGVQVSRRGSEAQQTGKGAMPALEVSPGRPAPIKRPNR